MKNLFLALALAGLTSTAVSAQEIGNSANSKFAKNYPVCRTGGDYKVCAPGMKSDLGRTGTIESSSMAMETTYVHLGSSTSSNARYRGRIRVTYDEPGAAYDGKESMINDGVRKNKIRNLNTNNGAYDLPPNDGSR